MLLNAFEKRLVTGSLRRVVQRRLDAARLLKLGGRVEDGTVLEIGCGRGFGVEAALDLFGAKQVHAFADVMQLGGQEQREWTERGSVAAGQAPRIWSGYVDEFIFGSG